MIGARDLEYVCTDFESMFKVAEKNKHIYVVTSDMNNCGSILARNLNHVLNYDNICLFMGVAKITILRLW